MNVVGMLFAVVWIALMVYVLSLATRLVAAVEEIARQVGTKNMGKVHQGPFGDAD